MAPTPGAVCLVCQRVPAAARARLASPALVRMRALTRYVAATVVRPGWTCVAVRPYTHTHTHTHTHTRTGCLAGSYSTNQASVCTPCPSNSASGVNASTCACNPGYSTTGFGASLTCTGTCYLSLSSPGPPFLCDYLERLAGTPDLLCGLRLRPAPATRQRTDSPCSLQCRLLQRRWVRVRRVPDREHDSGHGGNHVCMRGWVRHQRHGHHAGVLRYGVRGGGCA